MMQVHMKHTHSNNNPLTHTQEDHPVHRGDQADGDNDGVRDPDLGDDSPHRAACHGPLVCPLPVPPHPHRGCLHGPPHLARHTQGLLVGRVSVCLSACLSLHPISLSIYLQFQLVCQPVCHIMLR